MAQNFEELCLNTIRFLAVDAIEKGTSGHPGAPMGMAPMAYTLWQRFLKHNPTNPDWTDRDRFILSAGHASMLLYAMLYLTGYDLSLDDIKMFRQWGSRTPGHPEHGITAGVEATTGPLGQGFANGVGMAIAERHLAARYNKPGFNIVDHYTYAICSDGDLMEGVASEAASLAGTLKLGKLIYLYDDNNISIEGNTDITFKEDVGQRFRAYGWQVIGPIDGMSIEAVDTAIKQARADIEHPSLIICNTTIGYGSPNKAGTGHAHGEPLGKEETLLTKQKLGWTYTEPFTVPEDVLKHFRSAVEKGIERESDWNRLLKSYAETYPEEARRFSIDIKGELPQGWDSGLDKLFDSSMKPLATREASGLVINALAARVPALLGGSADLAPSTKTLIKNGGDFAADTYTGRNMHFGIREHAMGAIANGMALHDGVIPYTATFLIFYDYMRPSVRLAALMGVRSVFLFTHDSIGLGEDGPTHQPVEHLLGLRSVPNLTTIRPADAAETIEAWKLALEKKTGPTALIFTRQALPILDHKEMSSALGVRRGGYTLWQASNKPELILIGTGSEVHIALEAARMLKEKGISSRVVSLPSWEIFEAQSEEYRRSVIPPQVKARISIEAGTTIGWCRYTGDKGVAVGIDHYGASAPGKVLYEKFGITAQRVVAEAMRLLDAG
ncbi:MAG: transketolase [Dehalococcoidia bacterium]|nr:MAG: transketolase [Dehalococcoidia bacterium]